MKTFFILFVCLFGRSHYSALIYFNYGKLLFVYSAMYFMLITVVTSLRLAAVSSVSYFKVNYCL